MLIASHVAESGDGLVWCDLDGTKRRGIRSLGAGGGWCGAERLARDAGPQADQSVYAYAATGWKNSYELRTLPEGAIIHTADVRIPGDVNCIGLAVHNRLLAMTLRPGNLLVLFDTAARNVIGTRTLEEIGGVAFDDHGRLLAATMKQIVRIDGLALGNIAVDENGKIDGRHQLVTVVTDGLSDPRQLLFDKGELFVADHGLAHQVKVFDANGKLLRTIGRAGGMQPGGYQQEAMQNPAGMTIDSRGRLWVVGRKFFVSDVRSSHGRRWYG